MKPLTEHKNFTINTIRLVSLGFIAAITGMLFFATGLSYADKPTFCGSCHSMQHVYTTWQNSSHQHFTCGDCHLPQENIIAKLYVKGENGLRHTYHEVLRDYPDTISFTTTANGIANNNCLRCHAYVVAPTPLAAGERNCIHCHRNLIHGRGQIEGGVTVE